MNPTSPTVIPQKTPSCPGHQNTSVDLVHLPEIAPGAARLHV